jgi:putative sigma-54 modulation protein
MNYTDHYKGIKLDIQAVDISIGDSVQQTIRTMLDKLERHAGKINFADVYLKKENAINGKNKFVRVRLGIPGPDAFAEDTGEHWETTIRNVADKIERQLEKVQSK